MKAIITTSLKAILISAVTIGAGLGAFGIVHAATDQSPAEPVTSVAPSESPSPSPSPSASPDPAPAIQDDSEDIAAPSVSPTPSTAPKPTPTPTPSALPTSSRDDIDWKSLNQCAVATPDESWAVDCRTGDPL